MSKPRRRRLVQAGDLTLPSNKKVRWFQETLLHWFSENARIFPWRRRRANNYTRIVSEVLLQRTRAEVVAQFLPDFLKEFPSWEALAQARSSKLQKYLKPIGLWRRRSASLRRLATEMARRKGKFPQARTDIEALPNVGQYIANAVLLFCHKEAQPLLDINMARVIERFFGPRRLADIRDDPYLQMVSKAVVTTGEPIAMNWAILDHASLICRIAKPLCVECPLVARCKFAKEYNYGNSRKT